jgi:hypothetical protein
MWTKYKTRLEWCNPYWNTQSFHMHSAKFFILNAPSWHKETDRIIHTLLRKRYDKYHPHKCSNRSQVIYVFNRRFIHTPLPTYLLIHKWNWSKLQSNLSTFHHYHYYYHLNRSTCIYNIVFFLLYRFICLSEIDCWENSIFSNTESWLCLNAYNKLINTCNVQPMIYVEMSLNLLISKKNYS